MGILPTLGTADLFNAGVSVVNGILNRKSVKDTNKMNMAIAKENNAAMERMMNENNRFNRESAIEMFNLENAYNDPSAVRERMEQAGYNPFFNANTSAFANNADAATPTANGVPSLQQPQLTPAPSVLNGVLSDIANTAKSLAEAKKAGFDVTRGKALLEKEVKGLDIENDWNEFKMNLDKTFGYSDRSWQNEVTRNQVREACARIENFAADTANKLKQGHILDVDVEIRKFEKALKAIDNKYYERMLKQSYINAVRAGNLTNAQIATEGAKQEELRASAANQRSQAAYTDAQKETVNQLRGPLVAAQKTGNLNTVVDILVKLTKTPAEVKEIEARIKNMNADERKKFAETIQTMINTGQSLISSEGKLHLPFLGDFGASFKSGK